MSTQLQHNSPTRGWVPCEAKVKCRFEHRSVEVSSNISEHQEAINAAAADGVIDTSEQAGLSKQIADSIFKKTPPEGQEGAISELEPQHVFPEIPRANVVLETHNRDLKTYRKNYEQAVENANVLYKELSKEHRTLTGAFLTNPTYIKPEYLKKNSTRSVAIEAQNEERSRVAFETARANDAKRNKEKQAQAKVKVPELTKQYETAKNTALVHKRIYDESQAAEGSAISLQGIPSDYLRAPVDNDPSQEVSPYSYNIYVQTLKKNDKLSDEEKTQNVERLRTKMIRSAISNHEEQLKPSLKTQAEEKINKLFSRKTNMPSVTDNQKIAQNVSSKLAKFAKEFQAAPWDTLIGE